MIFNRTLFGSRLLQSSILTPRAILTRHQTERSGRVLFATSSNSPIESKSYHKTVSCGKSQPSSISSRSFWSSKLTWNRASVNTLRCLVGCTLGDFSAMWLLQMYYPDLGMGVIMPISMASGISTSVLLETVLLRMGRDKLPWLVAAKTAIGMSFISMLTMEIAENLVDYQLTGGTVSFDSPAFWAAAVLSMAAGFLAPLPYNYIRLRKYGKSCH